MADAQKKPDSDTLGIVFKSQKPKQDDASRSPIEELYSRSLASISNPGKKDVRVFNVENAFAGKSIEAGTIVSDRRKDRPTLLQNIGDAFMEWQSHVATALGIEPEIPTPPAQRSVNVSRQTAPQPTVQDAAKSLPNKSPVPDTETTSDDKSSIREAKDSGPAEKATRPIQKIRTFKSDSELLQPVATTDSVARIPPVKEAPAQAAPIPKKKEESPAPEPKSLATEISKIVPAEPAKKSAVTPEIKKDNAPKKSVPMPPADMRATMIAPDVQTRLKTKASAFVPPQKITKPANEPKLLYAFHVPDIINVTNDVDVPHARVAQVTAPSPKVTTAATASWTHTRADAPTPTVVSIPPIVTAPAVHEEAPALPPLRETTVPVMAHEARTIAHEPVVEPAPTRVAFIPNLPISPAVESTPVVAVKPHEEQVPQENKLSPETTSNVPVPTVIPTFHAPIGDNALAEQKTAEVQIPVAPRPVAVPAPVAKTPAPRSGILHFALILIGALIVAGVLVGGGVYLYSERDTAPDRETNPRPTPEENTQPTTVPATAGIVLSETPTLFMDRISQAIRAAPAGLTEIEIYTGTPVRNATAQEFFAHLEVSLMPRSIRALSSGFVVGSITTTKNEPFILIRSLNFDALFAGLLDWEKRMYVELAPLFGTDIQTEAQFEDAVRDNKSIRILKSADGQELLLYSFIDERTVLITTSGEALATLLNYY